MARLSFQEDVVYIKSASVVGVHERTHNPKRYTFQINLEWSDGNTSSSFRSYSELFEFQCELLDAFPLEAGKDKNTERIIPYLPGKKLFRLSSRRLAEERLPQVNEYVQKLVAMPENICTCDIVLRFFRSNWSEDRLRCRKPGSLRQGSSSSSQDERSLSVDGAVKYSVKRDSLVVQPPFPPASR